MSAIVTKCDEPSVSIPCRRGFPAVLVHDYVVINYKSDQEKCYGVILKKKKIPGLKHLRVTPSLSCVVFGAALGKRTNIFLTNAGLKYLCCFTSVWWYYLNKTHR